VLRRCEPGDVRATTFGAPYADLCWLKLSSVRVFRTRPLDVYRLAAPRSLAVSDATPSFALHDGYFPLESPRPGDSAPVRVEFVETGDETVSTTLGALPCRKFEARERGDTPVETRRLVGEFWTNAGVPPLGIVRARTSAESMTLVARGHARPGALPSAIEPVIRGRSLLSEACESCHGNTCRELLDPPR